MKRVLCLFLISILLSGLLLSVSCNCEDELAKLPYGEVIDWSVQEGYQYKDQQNRSYDESTVYDAIADNSITVYQLAVLLVDVVNKGEYGILTFHAACHLDTLNDRNQDSQNITLASLEESEVIFQFWVKYEDFLPLRLNNQLSTAFTVQAVNLQDIVDD